MYRVLLADTDRENVKNLYGLLEKEHGIIPEIWRSSRRCHAFFENAESGIVFIRIDNRSVPGLELTQAAAARNSVICVVWMAENGAYAMDAFRYGAEAYMLLPVTGETLRKTIDSLKIMNKYIKKACGREW